MIKITTEGQWEVVDCLADDDRVVATFPTHRRALNHTRKLEPTPSVRRRLGNRIQHDWRFQIRKAQS